VTLTATASVSGTESSTSTTFVLPMLADYLKPGTGTPPGFIIRTVSAPAPRLRNRQPSLLTLYDGRLRAAVFVVRRPRVVATPPSRLENGWPIWACGLGAPAQMGQPFSDITP